MRIALAILLAATILGPSSTQAQVKRAKTEDGKEVILKADGTWTYEYKREKAAQLAYEGKRGTFSLYLVPERWKKLDKVDNEDAEVGFRHKDGDAFVIVIAERIQIPLATLKKAQIERLRSVDENARITFEEKRTVNGKELLCMTSEFVVEGIPAAYHGYYYSGDEGSIQVIAWTGRNLFKELKPEIEAFLNGLEIAKTPPPPERVPPPEVQPENGGALKDTSKQNDQSGAAHRLFAPKPLHDIAQVRQEYPLGASVRQYCPRHGYNCPHATPATCQRLLGKSLWPSPWLNPAPGGAKKNVLTPDVPADGPGKPTVTGKSPLLPRSFDVSPSIPSAGIDGGRTRLSNGYGGGGSSSLHQQPTGGGLGGAIGAALAALLGSIAWIGRKIKRALWPRTNA